MAARLPAAAVCFSMSVLGMGAEPSISKLPPPRTLERTNEQRVKTPICGRLLIEKNSDAEWNALQEP